MDKKSIVYLFCIILPLAAIGFIGYEQTNRYFDAGEKNERTHEIREELQTLLTLTVDSETGVRGFIITGQESYLDPSIKAQGEIEKHMRKAEDLLTAYPDLEEKLQAEEVLINKKLERLEHDIYLRKQKGFDAAADYVSTGAGRKLMDQIRAGMRQITEQLAVDSKVAPSTKPVNSGQRLFRISAVLSIFALILIGCNIFWARIR